MDRFMKRLGCAALMAVLLISLYGCQQTPTTQPVVNKNDGAFDSSVIESASEIPAVDSTQTIAQTFFGDYTAITIRSGDRDVTFRPGSLVLEDESATLDGNTAESEDSQ